MPAKRQHWLIKSEPDVFSFSDLLGLPQRTTTWDGVRNYQARNYLREMRRGDLVFFYHSSTEPPGIAGIAEVAREAYADPTQFDHADEHFDARSKPDAPTWVAVDLRGVEALPRLVALEELRQEPALATLQLLQKGSRLSVQPVQEPAWRLIKALSKRKSRL
ncbi:MAG TPA: EVE domain-containing protein [Planctomycetota bacterium]|nr:EVE domain-containing protein [Planctomycetota bacterium]